MLATGMFELFEMCLIGTFRPFSDVALQRVISDDLSQVHRSRADVIRGMHSGCDQTHLKHLMLTTDYVDY